MSLRAKQLSVGERWWPWSSGRSSGLVAEFRDRSTPGNLPLGKHIELVKQSVTNRLSGRIVTRKTVSVRPHWWPGFVVCFVPERSLSGQPIFSR